MENFDTAATAPMKVSASETFEEYSARVWSTRAQTGLPAEPLARCLFALASVNPYAAED